MQHVETPGAAHSEKVGVRNTWFLKQPEGHGFTRVVVGTAPGELVPGPVPITALSGPLCPCHFMKGGADSVSERCPPG